MMTIGQRLDRARTEAGLSKAELARRTGMAVANVANILNGRKQPAFETVERLRVAIGVSYGVLFDEPHISLSPSDVKLGRRFHELLGRLLDADEEQKRLRETDDRVLGRQKKRPPDILREGREPVRIDPRSEVVSLPNEIIPQQYVRQGATRAYKVVSDVMQGIGIFEGSTIYVRRTPHLDAADGQVIVCRLNGPLFLKRLDLRGQQIVLHSENRSEEITVEKDDEFSLIGVICEA